MVRGEGMEENKREVAEIARTDMQDSKKREEKGKGKGRFLVERRKDWREEESKLEREIGEEMLMSRIKNKKDRDVRIVSIYNSGKKWKRLSKRHGKIEGRKLLYQEIFVLGNFNIRIGEGEEEEMGRKSKDKIISNRGRNIQQN